MRRALVALVSVALGCASGGVRLEGYRGAYTTHFEGIPDRAEVCALVTNHGDARLDWVRLRLRSYSHLGEEPGRWTSHWVYRRAIEPGQTVALRLVDPPVADEIDLRVIAAGSGPGPMAGRSVARAQGCSEARVARPLESRIPARNAAGIVVHAVALRDDRSTEIFSAQRAR